MNNHQKKKILVVDDDKIVCMVHQLFFSAVFEVVLAHNGVEALELLKCERFDLVLTDINMPLMNGLVLTKEIRKLKSDNRVISVIGITSMEPDEIAEEAQLAGINLLFKKPVELSEVNSKISELFAA